MKTRQSLAIYIEFLKKPFAAFMLIFVISVFYLLYDWSFVISKEISILDGTVTDQPLLKTYWDFTRQGARVELEDGKVVVIDVPREIDLSNGQSIRVSRNELLLGGVNHRFHSVYESP